MQNFIDKLHEVMDTFKNMPPEQVAEAVSAPQRQDTVNAISGDNIRFYGNTELSDNYKNTLTDAIRFYQKEFNLIPHATIARDPQWLAEEYGEGAQGAAYPFENVVTGQHDVVLKNLTANDEDEVKEMENFSESVGWAPKNSKGLSHVPVHELGHILYDMLVPKTEENEQAQIQSNKIYTDALKDMGVVDLTKPHTDKDREKGMEEVKKISGYAGSEKGNMPNTDEVVAEAISDYYYNRKDAAPLSKAIVQRLKNDSYTYGMRKAGEMNPYVSASTFMNNLRRYKVIQ